MARPTKLYLDYFSHDTDATNDEKMDMFRSMYGNDGYAFYFIILEKVYRTENAMIDLSKNIFVVGLAKKLMISVEKFYEMLETAFELEMFDRDLFESEKKLTSNGIQKRFADVMKQRNQWKKIKEIKEKEFSNEKTNNNYEFSNEKTIGKTRQRKGNRKEKEIESEIKNNDLDSSESISASFSSDVIFLTDLLVSEIKKNNPQAKTPAKISNWRNDIRLLLADGYDRDQIEKVINWCQADEFWKSNILSAKKLREKIGTLILQMGRKDDAKPWTNSKRPVVEIAKFEGYNEIEISPERMEQIREDAKRLEEKLRMRKVQ